MTEPENASNPVGKRPHKRRKRTAWVLLALFGLVAIFHRPLLISALHTAGVRLAARQNIRLNFDIGGSVLTGITLNNIRATPMGPSPVDLIEIESLRVRYDLLRLFRHGISDFITAYHLRNASLIISQMRGTKSQQEELARVLRDIIQQPALFSDRVRVENFNLSLITRNGPLIVAGANVLLDPVTPGFLHFGRISIPKVAAWRDIDAPASFIDRHLIARDFRLGNEVAATRFELDASQRSKGIQYLSFEGTVLGGDVGLFLWNHQINRRTSEAQLTAFVGNLSLKRLHDFSRWKPPVSGRVVSASLQLAGNPNSPSGWSGSCVVEGNDVMVSGFHMDKAVTDLRIANGIAHLERGEVITGQNRFHIQLDRRLPHTPAEMIASGFEARLALEAPEISKVHTALKAVASGTLHATGRFQIDHDKFVLALNSSVSSVAGSATPAVPFSMRTGTASVCYTHRFQDRPHTPWFHGTDVAADANIQGLCLGLASFESASAAGEVRDGKATLSSVQLRRGANAVVLSGSLAMPSSGRSHLFRNANYAAQFTVTAPNLAAFATPSSGLAMSGSLTASGAFRHTAEGFDGRAKAEGCDLVFQQFTARRLELDVPVEKSRARSVSFLLDVNGKDRLTGEGALDLYSPFGYEAQVLGRVQNIGIFQPLLGTPLSGSLDVDWHGSGELKNVRHSGKGQVSIANGRVADFTGVNGGIAGSYSMRNSASNLPHTASVNLRSDQGSLQATVRLQDRRLQVEQLRVGVAGMGAVSGSFSLATDLRTPDRPASVFPPAGAVEGSLTLESIDLARLSSRISAIPQGSGVQGRLSGSLTARGTLGAPEIAAGFKVIGLRAPNLAKLPAGSAALSLTYKDDRLRANGALFEPGISPLQITAEAPLSLSRIAAERGIALDTPISAAVKLPPSSASLLTQITPAIRYAEGRIGIQATCVGTLAHPIFDGGVTLDLPALRLQNPDAPTIANVRGNLRLSGDELVVQELQGDVAGGPFAVAGRANLDRLTDPQLDLRLRSEGTLLIRNESLTLRADSDLRVTGPLSAAQVTGKIGIVKSRFYRDIEILPLGLPGKPAPRLAQPRIKPSIDIPPFRNWGLSVDIKTAEPFTIRSNLATGQAFADLHLGGNGLAPTLEGSVRMENFVASLPFSRLNIDYGHLYFSPDDPFNPTLDIHGTSRIRDYYIGAYIYGTVSEPQTVFTSEPPLAQEEVIALLATGATSREVTENSQVLAGRAGVLLLQDLYHKIFKKRGPQTEAKPDQPLDRFSLDVGTVDPRTGRQEINGRFKLSDQYEIGAGVDVQGDVQVQLRYLLRFR